MPRIGGPLRGEGLQAVGMALQILEHLAARRGAQGVTELARAMQTTKSRMHRHLRSLIAGGYVVQPPGSGKYLIGGRLLTLGRCVPVEPEAPVFRAVAAEAAPSPR
jgi:IclR family KDG regulon transcriptional repressor